MAVERVAGSSWNQWPDVHGMGGRMPVESALDAPNEREDGAPLSKHVLGICSWTTDNQ